MCSTEELSFDASKFTAKNKLALIVELSECEKQKEDSSFSVTNGNNNKTLFYCKQINSYKMYFPVYPSAPSFGRQ